MSNIFDILKMVTVNHQGVSSPQIVVTDVAGKPNGLLTDLLRDALSNMRLFVDIDDVDSANEVLSALNIHTPLPDDVLDEYAKILKEPVLGLNLAPQKDQIVAVRLVTEKRAKRYFWSFCRPYPGRTRFSGMSKEAFKNECLNNRHQPRGQQTVWLLKYKTQQTGIQNGYQSVVSYFFGAIVYCMFRWAKVVC